jgi:hypothetical protein
LFDHRAESVDFSGEPSGELVSSEPVGQGEKRRLPRLDDKKQAVFLQHVPDLRERLIQVLGKAGQVMQAAMDCGDVLRAGRVGKTPTISNDDASTPGALRGQGW